MSAVTVDVPGRADFTPVDRPAGLGSGNEPAGTDKLVVAIGLGEALASLADAVPVFGRIEFENIVTPLKAVTQPATQEGILGPIAVADARPIRPTSFVESRVFWIDAAVDDADDQAFTVQSEFPAQPTIVIEQFEEVEAEIGRQRPDLVLPDFENFRQIGKLVSVCWV